METNFLMYMHDEEPTMKKIRQTDYLLWEQTARSRIGPIIYYPRSIKHKIGSLSMVAQTDVRGFTTHKS